MSAIKTLREYLAWMAAVRASHGWPNREFCCMEDFVLDRGVSYESGPLGPGDAAFVRQLLGPVDVTQYRYGECYKNCQLLIARDTGGRLKYIEGFATAGVLPVVHAWLDLDGRVIDPTWREGGNALENRVIGAIPPDFAYFGVEVASRDEVISRMFSEEMCRGWLDDWENGWPLITGERRTPKPKAIDEYKAFLDMKGAQSIA